MAATVVLLALVTAALFAIRLTGPLNLLDNEYRIGASVLDVLQNGRWLCPHDALGNTDKPPLLVWLSTLVSLPTGRVTPFTLYLPSALAVLANSWLVFAVGRRYFGERAAILAAFAYLLCDAAASQVATARWDALFALTVALTAFAGLRAWIDGVSWTWFWLAGAVSTLTKGPLGVLLAAFGFVAVPWERRTGHPSPLRGSHRAGIVLYLAIVFGWFLSALAVEGRHLVDEMLVGELVGHAVEHAPFRRFLHPPGNYLAMAAPWSLLCVVALWRVFAHPSADDRTRRVERFLSGWFLGGLLIFAISPHNAARLLYPLLPASSLLAGREMARWAESLGGRTLRAGIGVAAIAACAIFVVRYHYYLEDPDLDRTAALGDVARSVHDRVGDEFPVVAVDVPYAFQLILNTRRPSASFAEAATLLGGEAPAFVVVVDYDRLLAKLGARASRTWTLAEGRVGGRPWVRLVGNRPEIAWAEPARDARGRDPGRDGR